jgi:hypothetical protein
VSPTRAVEICSKQRNKHTGSEAYSTVPPPSLETWTSLPFTSHQAFNIGGMAKKRDVLDACDNLTKGHGLCGSAIQLCIAWRKSRYCRYLPRQTYKVSSIRESRPGMQQNRTENDFWEERGSKAQDACTIPHQQPFSLDMLWPRPLNMLVMAEAKSRHWRSTASRCITLDFIALRNKIYCKRLKTGVVDSVYNPCKSGAHSQQNGAVSRFSIEAVLNSSSTLRPRDTFPTSTRNYHTRRVTIRNTWNLV